MFLNPSVGVEVTMFQNLKVETSVAGTDVWDKGLKEEYAKAAEALKELGIVK